MISVDCTVLCGAVVFDLRDCFLLLCSFVGSTFIDTFWNSQIKIFYIQVSAIRFKSFTIRDLFVIDIRK